MLKFYIGNCEVSVSTGFFAVITLMLITCDSSLVLASLLCSVFHELGHIVVMLFFGERLQKISFCSFGMRIDKATSASLGYGREIIVSLAGIFANCILALVAFCCFRFFNIASAQNIAVVSLAVALFNLIPVDSLDGARALRFFLLLYVQERQVDTVLFSLSVACTVLLSAFAVFTLICYQVNFSLIAVTAYLVIVLVSHIFAMKC